jgi:hypothetical protein
MIEPADRHTLRQAWNAYCDALREEGQSIIAGETCDARDAQELAEALRAVARIGIMSLQHRMDFNDPDFPVFFRALDDRFKYGAPDANITYLQTTVRGDATYRIHAQHHGRMFNINPRWNQDVALWAPKLEANADGSFDVVVSAEQQSGNFLQIDRTFRGDEHVPDNFPMADGGIVVRSYYWDWNDDRPPGSFYIERVDAQAPPYPAPLTPSRFATQLRGATELLRKAARWWITRSVKVRDQNVANQIAPPNPVPPGVKDWKAPQGTPINYGTCCWDLAPDEALYIESELPDGPHWSFQLVNAWWEAPDQQNRQASIGHTQAYIDLDGRFRAVIAHRDPGVPNWLDTGDARRGFLWYRWFQPRNKQPVPTVRVVKIDDLSSCFPEQHPRVDAAARKAQLAIRRVHMAQRFQR